MNLATTYIINSDKLNFYKYQNLINLLYKPIIGNLTFSIYFTILSSGDISASLKNQQISVQYICDSNRCEFEEFLDSIKQLQFLNLLKIYFSKNKNNLFFEFLSPLTVNEFWENTEYKKIFLEKASDYNLTIVQELLNQKVDLTDYCEITSNSKNEIMNEEETLPFNEVVNNISIVDKSIASELDIKIEPQDLKSLKIKQLKELTSEEYLKILKEKEITKSEKNIIITLREKLQDEVINCLLEYVFVKNNKYIKKSYITKIANTLEEIDISTAEQAMEYLSNAYQAAKQFSNQENKSVNNDIKVVSEIIKSQNQASQFGADNISPDLLYLASSESNIVNNLVDKLKDLN